MPVKSQAQRAYLNMKFGHDWVKQHGFDQKGHLPEHVRKRTRKRKHMIPKKDSRGFY